MKDRRPTHVMTKSRARNDMEGSPPLDECSVEFLQNRTMLHRDYYWLRRRLLDGEEKIHVMNISFRKGFVGTNNKPTNEKTR